MKLKVCGLRDRDNIQDILQVSPDFIGLIFYEKSPRYVGALSPDIIRDITSAVKVGVFVNASYDHIMACKETYGLDMIQLHGEEDLTFVQALRRAFVPVIKVFRILDELPGELDDFRPYSDLFLFDTRTALYGGSGQSFDWSILKGVDHPFMLSGGIDMENIAAIKALKLKHLVGLDINSKFETSPGQKDVNKIRMLKKEL